MARPKKEDKPKTSSVKESKAVTSQKKVVKKETAKNTKLNTFENVEKKRKNVSTKESKTEPIANIETETKNKINNEQVLTSIEAEAEVEVTNEPILPETFILDEKQSSGTKEQLSAIEPQIDKKDSVPFDLGKIFELKLGAEFLDGHLRIQTEATKIQRRSEENYHVFGQIEQGAPFDVTFECVDREEADYLWVQLLDYERNPDKYIKEVPKTEQPPVFEQPAVTNETSVVNEVITNQVNTKPIEPEKKIEDFSGIPLTTVDLDSIINSIPETKKEQAQPTNTQNPVQHLATATNISHIINNQNVAQMESYGESIASHINGSFQANLWGAMPMDAVKMFIGSCSTEYTYNFKNDGKGYFMEVTKDKTTVRIPKKLDEYLKIS